MQLHKADPKPENAMEFIRNRLTDPVSAEDFLRMKQNLGELNKDVGQMKADMTNISKMVSKLFPKKPMAGTDGEAGAYAEAETETEVATNVNMSITSSMANNVGDTSHLQVLDDSSMIFDQTIVNPDDLNSTMQTDDEPSQLNDSVDDAMNTSQSKDVPDDSAQNFTMEIVEVDVVNKSSLNVTTESQEEEKEANENMQIDEIALGPVIVTSTPDESATENMTNAIVSSIQIEDLPIVFKDDSDEQA